MKINKDLVDAVMMLSFIILVLVGSSDFTNAAEKNIIMGGLGVLYIVMIILRIIQIRQAPQEEESSEYN